VYASRVDRMLHLPPVHEDPAGVSPFGAVDELHDLGAAGATKPASPSDLARRSEKDTSVHTPRFREPLDPEDFLARSTRSFGYCSVSARPTM